MRVTNRSISRNYLKQYNTAYSNYAETNAKIASGYSFTSASENVSSSSQLLKARTAQYKVDAQLENVERYTEEVGTTEDTLSTYNDILTEIHSELMVKAQSETTGDTGYSAIAEQIGELKDELVTLMNQQYSGKYLFGGTNASSAPFTLDSNGYLSYNGIAVDDIEQDSDGYYYLDSSNNRVDVPMNDSMYIDIGNGIAMTGNQVEDGSALCVTYSGLDVFGCGTNSAGISNNIINVLTELQTAVENGDTEDMATYNNQLGELQEVVQITQTDVGVKQNVLERAQSRLELLSDNYNTRISNLIGIDDAEEATNQSLNDYVLKAVLAVGASLLPTSLMDYIG